jgi:hypothetical protein
MSRAERSSRCGAALSPLPKNAGASLMNSRNGSVPVERSKAPPMIADKAKGPAQR